ncbi:lipopolysaccharide-induced tumor necrosis factor-alpha factor homolog isoform X2 [Battus philenor]|uniref:lipopolysaccharide-induced tumor necrosis factor-alpha factor homolog isoform X2 n=1 Tax=Battus philenor TaxID=42288 RepID=UPI0035D0A0DE
MQSGYEMKEQGVAPPPYPGYPPNPPVVTSQPVIVGTTVTYPATVVPAEVTAVVVGSPMGTTPAVYMCKSCNNQIITRVERRPSIRTHLFAMLLCVIGCWPCVCLPYCVDSCNNADHYCTNCNSYIGSYVG